MQLGVLAICAVVLAVRAAPVHAATILVVGDSLSAGYGLALDSGWVHLLAERVRTRHQVVNASISGDTTAGGLRRLDGLLSQHRPDVVVIELGGNDGLRGLALEVVEENLEQMIRKSQAAGAAVLLAGMRIPPNLGPVYAERFHAIYAELSRRHRLAFVPFLLEGVATVPGMMQDDGIHASAAGQTRILENVWEVLAPVLSPPPDRIPSDRTPSPRAQ